VYLVYDFHNNNNNISLWIMSNQSIKIWSIVFGNAVNRQTDGQTDRDENVNSLAEVRNRRAMV